MVHNYHEFEAGFDYKNIFRHLIIDPGNKKWEQNCPGALYVALSREKTVGNFKPDTPYPKDSAIYWYGCGISETQILEGHKKNNKNKGGPKEMCMLIKKRERWVAYCTKTNTGSNQNVTLLG